MLATRNVGYGNQLGVAAAMPWHRHGDASTVGGRNRMQRAVRLDASVRATVSRSVDATTRTRTDVNLAHAALAAEHIGGARNARSIHGACALAHVNHGVPPAASICDNACENG